MLARWTGVVQDDAGNAVTGASIEVRSETTGALVPVYVDREGVVALGNPFTATEATFAFHAPGDAYRITARAGSLERVWRFVAIGTAQEFDFADLAETMQAGVYPAATRAALNAYVPEEGQAIAGVVLNDPNPAINGYYIRVGNAWVRQRGLPDTLARLQVTGGTANAVQAGGSPGVDPATVSAFVIDVTTQNTGNVTLSVNGGPARAVLNVQGNQFAPGQFVGRLFLTNEGTQYREIVGSDIVARAYAEAERAQAAASVATGAATASTQEANRSRDEADRADAAATSVENPVSYAPQDLTPAQQDQVRENIGVGSVGTINLPAEPAGRVLGDDGSFVEMTGVDALFDGPLGKASGEQEVARQNIGANDASNLTTGTLLHARVPQNLDPTRAFRRGNILGPVTQSGGVPTGAIIERGANANGEYVRFADGTQICTNGGLSLSSNVVVTLPSPFANGNYACSVIYTASADRIFAINVRTTTSFTVRVQDASAAFVSANPSSFIAIGRWF